MIRHAHHRVKGIAKWLVIVVLGTPALSQTDDLRFAFPTGLTDCQISMAPSWPKLRDARKRYSSCVQEYALEKWSSRACHYNNSQPPQCSGIDQQICALELQLPQEIEACRSRAEKAMADAAEARRIAEAEERAARDAQSLADTQARRAMKMAQDALKEGNPGLGQKILERFISQTDPTHLPKQLVADFEGIQRALNTPQTPVGALSEAVTKTSLDAFGSITKNVEAQLGGAVGGGAFDVDAGAGGGSAAGALGGSSTPVPGGYSGTNPVQAPNGFTDIATNWETMSGLGQVTAILSIIATIGIIMENDGPVPPSLIDGTFAANIVALSEAAAGGNFKFGGDVDVYEATTSIVTEEMVSKRDSAAERERFETAARQQEEAQLQAEADQAIEDLLAAQRARNEKAEAQMEIEEAIYGSDSDRKVDDLVKCINFYVGPFPESVQR
jgi:hypothetical protein